MPRLLLLLTFAVTAALIPRPAAAGDPELALDICSRLELFVDDYLVGKITGDVEQQLQRPEPREVALVTDAPWEGNTCAYYSIFRDGDVFRMYYRGSHYDVKTKKAAHGEVTCYAESRDGIHWTKPRLGLFEFDGSKENNIVWDGIGTHDFTPFKDENPDCEADARYKAMARGRPRGQKGMYAFKSPDGIHWTPISDGPVITEGAFDSQNLAFWDPHAKLYREYHRSFSGGRRVILTGTSSDFVHWTKPVMISFDDDRKEHLYTNAVRCYPRAPHILIGFPTRYHPERNSQVEPIFMSSRDGRAFRRWQQPVIPPTAPEDRAGNRSNYMTWGLVEVPGDQEHYSVYATEAYYTGPDSRVRRFTYRKDGFVALHGGEKGGELVTKPLKFRGGGLVLNHVTAEGGLLRVEIQDANGKPLEGFALADCRPLTGDSLAGAVSWAGGGDLKSLEGRAVRLRLVLKNADVYSLRFQ